MGVVGVVQLCVFAEQDCFGAEQCEQRCDAAAVD